MTVVSYDEGKMRSAIRAYKGALDNVRRIREQMTTEVNKIKENWKGTDREKAENDLNNIVEQMKSVEQNLTEIVKMFGDAASNFNQLNY